MHGALCVCQTGQDWVELAEIVSLVYIFLFTSILISSNSMANHPSSTSSSSKYLNLDVKAKYKAPSYGNSPQSSLLLEHTTHLSYIHSKEGVSLFSMTIFDSYAIS